MRSLFGPSVPADLPATGLLMLDLMCGPNAPLTAAFLFCGWRAGRIDILLNPAQDFL